MLHRMNSDNNKEGTTDVIGDKAKEDAAYLAKKAKVEEAVRLALAGG